VILLCDEGYRSSLAAATLKRFGLEAPPGARLKG
jgi:rhodanese-related sulfurtransferase